MTPEPETITATVVFQFNKDQTTVGSDNEQIYAALKQVNEILRKQGCGLGAMIVGRDWRSE